MFSETFKALRKKRGLSQRALADHLGLSKSAVSMYELGSREPDFETLEKIADFFNVDLNFLLGESKVENEIQQFVDLRVKQLFPKEAFPIGQALTSMSPDERSRALAMMKAAFPDHFDK